MQTTDKSKKLVGKICGAQIIDSEGDFVYLKVKAKLSKYSNCNGDIEPGKLGNLYYSEVDGRLYINSLYIKE